MGAHGKEIFYNDFLMNLSGSCRYNGDFFNYILMLDFEIIVERTIVCSILLFFLHPSFGMVWIVVCKKIQNMQRYIANEKSHVK